MERVLPVIVEQRKANRSYEDQVCDLRPMISVPRYKNKQTLQEISSFHFIFGYVLPSGALHLIPELFSNGFLSVQHMLSRKIIQKHMPVLQSVTKTLLLLSLKREQCKQLTTFSMTEQPDSSSFHRLQSAGDGIIKLNWGTISK